MSWMKCCNKKGSVGDTLIIGILFLSFAISMLICYTVISSINTEIQAQDAFGADSKNAFSDIKGKFTGVLDNMSLFFVVGLSVLALFLASLVRVHPVFFIFFLVILTVIIYLTSALSNIYLYMANTDVLSSFANELTFITHIIGVMPWIVGIIGTIMSILMYKNYTEAAR